MGRKSFIEKFKKFADPDYKMEKVAPGEFNTYMPWRAYAGMTEEDLGAIYDYLQTIKPVYKQVTIFEHK